jgi:MgtE intracellular N domain
MKIGKMKTWNYVPVSYSYIVISRSRHWKLLTDKLFQVVTTIPVGVHPIDIDAQVETPKGSAINEIIPPATFILGVFGRLNQTDYYTFTKVLTPTEKNDLLTSPDEGSLDNFLNKLSPSELKQISNTLTTSEFNIILQKLPQDENKKIISRIQSASS